MDALRARQLGFLDARRAWLKMDPGAKVVLIQAAGCNQKLQLVFDECCM